AFIKPTTPSHSLYAVVSGIWFSKLSRVTSPRCLCRLLSPRQVVRENGGENCERSRARFGKRRSVAFRSQKCAASHVKTWEADAAFGTSGFLTNAPPLLAG